MRIGKQDRTRLSYMPVTAVSVMTEKVGLAATTRATANGMGRSKRLT